MITCAMCAGAGMRHGLICDACKGLGQYTFYPVEPPKVTYQETPTVTLPFKWRDRVSIDKSDVVGVVTGFALYERGTEVQVSWFVTGAQHVHWISAERLTLVAN